jgi:recombination protein RecA
MDARVRKLSDFVPPPRVVSAWGLDALFGRFVELSGARATGVLSAAFGLVLEAQRRGELVAWVTLPRGTFFPPDAAEGGVDLDALVVVRVPEASAAARAADQLVRSGGFGLVVLDLGGHAGDARLPAPLQSRLGGLAQKHDAAVVALTEKTAEQASLGALVSLRAEARREADHTCTVRVLKDKRRGPGDAHVEACRPPAGLATATPKALPFRPTTRA